MWISYIKHKTRINDAVTVSTWHWCWCGLGGRRRGGRDRALREARNAAPLECGVQEPDLPRLGGSPTPRTQPRIPTTLTPPSNAKCEIDRHRCTAFVGCGGSTYAVLVIEMFLGLAVFMARRWKALAMMLGFLFHLGIAIALGLISFAFSAFGLLVFGYGYSVFGEVSQYVTTGERPKAMGSAHIIYEYNGKGRDKDHARIT